MPLSLCRFFIELADRCHRAGEPVWALVPERSRDRRDFERLKKDGIMRPSRSRWLCLALLEISPYTGGESKRIDWSAIKSFAERSALAKHCPVSKWSAGMTRSTATDDIWLVVDLWQAVKKESIAFQHLRDDHLERASDPSEWRGICFTSADRIPASCIVGGFDRTDSSSVGLLPW